MCLGLVWGFHARYDHGNRACCAYNSARTCAAASLRAFKTHAFLHCPRAWQGALARMIEIVVGLLLAAANLITVEALLPTAPMSRDIQGAHL
jgi:hypothetical protein